MKIKDLYLDSKPVFSFEFFPPKTPQGEQSLLGAAGRLKELGASFLSMTYGAGGSTREKTIELSDLVRSTSGVETVCHVTCVGQSRDEVRAVLEQMRDRGMMNVMALRGDPPRGEAGWTPHPDGFRYAAELVREAKSLGDFSVAVAGFPEIHPESPDRETDLRMLKLKIDSGADVVVTQLFFDTDAFIRFDRALKSARVEIPIVPGIMPIQSVGQVRRFTALCGSAIPPELDARLTEVENDDEAARALGVEYAAEQIARLLDYGVPGVHIYCLNKTESSEEIFEKLGLRRPA